MACLFGEQVFEVVWCLASKLEQHSERVLLVGEARYSASAHLTNSFSALVQLGDCDHNDLILVSG